MQQYTPNTELVRQYARDADALGLSARAKERLTWLLHYCENGHSVSATCRQFGIPRMTLYRVLQRFEFDDARSLEDQSRRPHTARPRATAAPQTVPQPVMTPMASAPQQVMPSAAAQGCSHPHCMVCRVSRMQLGKKLKGAFLLTSMMVNIAFLSFLLMTALLEGKNASANLNAPASGDAALSASLLP